MNGSASWRLDGAAGACARLTGAEVDELCEFALIESREIPITAEPIARGTRVRIGLVMTGVEEDDSLAL